MSTHGFEQSNPAMFQLSKLMPAEGSPTGGESLRAGPRKAGPPISKWRLLSTTAVDSAADRLEALVSKLAPFPLQEG